jgi:hypothetical protein
MSNIVTPEFRVSFPHVFAPQEPMQPGGDSKYSIVMLFPKDADLSQLKAAANEALAREFGEDKKKWPKGLRNPFRDQGEKEKDGVLPEGYEAGAIFITATSKQKPGVVDANVQPILDSSQIYAGCYARASVRAYAYNKAGNAGVSFGLQNVQKTRDGESLTGRLKPEDEFKPVEGAGGDAGYDPFA